jgi:hypothetical protein
MEGATRRYRWEGGGRGWSLMGEVVPRCGAGSLIKIVVREGMSQGVMVVRVARPVRVKSVSHRCVQVLIPVMRKLQLKRVTVEVCMVFRELCPCPRGASWLRPAWVR